MSTTPPTRRTGSASSRKKGYPRGSCTITVASTSDDGATVCGGQLTDIAVVAGAENTFVTVVVQCITDPRYDTVGGFKECWPPYQFAVGPTQQAVGDDIDVEFWCYDPGGDGVSISILFITAASSVDPEPANWVACGLDPAFPPTLLPCPHLDPPLTGSPSATAVLTCNVSNETCVVIVSPDGFASPGRDPADCTGESNRVIPVFCGDPDHP
ncbi:MAG: hypothetical protein JRJ24_21025 [Deltaproteobacteria bacterium]|nr:hypothetical protein [Deltaproteobacteria bacterium]